MKKSLFAIALISAVCFTACKSEKPDDPKPGTEVSIVVNPHDVVLTIEEPSIRLAATITPDDPNAAIVWSTSDTTVAVVNSRGYVEATGFGECYIYAAYKDVKDSCHISVKTYLESLVFNSIFLNDLDTTYFADKEGVCPIDTMKREDGDYYAYPTLATMLLFSDGFYVNESYQLDGAEQGAMIEVPVIIHYATPYLNSLRTYAPAKDREGGILFILGGYELGTELGMYSGPAGTMDEVEYIKQMKNFVEAVNTEDANYVQYLRAAAATQSEPTISVYEYDAEAETYVSSYIHEAILEKGAFYIDGRNYAASTKMYSVEYAAVKYKPLAQDDVFGWFSGLNLDWNKETDIVSFKDEQVHFDPSVITTYGELPQEGGSEVQMIKVEAGIDNHEVAARIREQIKEKQANVIRMKH